MYYRGSRGTNTSNLKSKSFICGMFSLDWTCSLKSRRFDVALYEITLNVEASTYDTYRHFQPAQTAVTRCSSNYWILRAAVWEVLIKLSEVAPPLFYSTLLFIPTENSVYHCVKLSGILSVQVTIRSGCGWTDRKRQRNRWIHDDVHKETVFATWIGLVMANTGSTIYIHIKKNILQDIIEIQQQPL